MYVPEISSLSETVQLKLLQFMRYKTVVRVGQDPRRRAFNVGNYLKAYNALFPAVSNWFDPMTGGTTNYPGGAFVPGYGPPKPYDFYSVAANVPAGAATYLGGNPDVTPYFQGPARPANPNENGWKDTFVMYPGEVTTVIVRFAPQGAAETAFALSQNYPNPFNPSTEIRFSLPQDSRVLLKVYNTLGQELQTLIDADAPAGFHTVRLDAGKLSSGVYLYRLQVGNFSAVKKMTVLK